MITNTIALILWLYLIVLFGRLALDWIQYFARDWRPRGAVLVIAEGVYTLTDPPLKALRRIIPPLRIGRMALDLAFTVLFLVVVIAANIVAAL